jgi:outer membrane protein assembly factor BamB
MRVRTPSAGIKKPAAEPIKQRILYCAIVAVDMKRFPLAPALLFFVFILMFGPCAAVVQTLKWKYQLNAASIPAVGPDGTVFVVSSDRNISAINATGGLKWKYQLNAALFQLSDYVPCLAVGPDGTVYVGSDGGNIYAINATGGLKWQFATGPLPSLAVGPNGTVYVGSDNRNIYAINAAGGLQWQHTTSGRVTSSPVVGPDGTVYAGSDGGQSNQYIYAIGATGGLKWKIPVLCWGSPALGPDGTVYVSDPFGDVYAFNATGGQIWKYFTADEFLSLSPALGPDGTVYVAGNFLHAINATGGLKWMVRFPLSAFGIGHTDFRMVTAPALGPDGTVYVVSYPGNTWAFTSTGQAKWKYDPPSQEHRPVIGPDGTVVYWARDNNIYAHTAAPAPATTAAAAPATTAAAASATTAAAAYSTTAAAAPATTAVAAPPSKTPEFVNISASEQPAKSSSSNIDPCTKWVICIKMFAVIVYTSFLF